MTTRRVMNTNNKRKADALSEDIPNLVEEIQCHDPTKKVNINFQDGSCEAFDFLVVGADPQDGLTSAVLEKTPEETEAFSKDNMKSFTFQTTLMKFPKADRTLPTVRFNPENMNVTAGSCYGYRSETRKETSYLAVKKKPRNVTAEFNKIFETVEYEYVTCYQLLDPTKHGEMTEQQMQVKLDNEMKQGLYSAWFPYKWESGERISRFHTKYFNHYTMESLTKGPNNWSILNFQGKNNTIYVHASTAFESVLHIYNYINLLWSSKRSIFPRNLSAKIAIIGAGPSGLLAARKLAGEGYTNIKILEAKPNDDNPKGKLFAGKTQTNTILGQLNAEIPAELGTCYLSPAYDHMVKDFESSGILEGQDRVSFDQIPTGPVLREIVTEDQFRNDGPIMTLIQRYPEIVMFNTMPASMDFEKYTYLKGFEEHYADSNLSPTQLAQRFQDFQRVVAEAVVRYLLIFWSTFGSDRPIPLRRTFLNSKLLDITIPEFLAKHELKSLTGTLQYGYSVQGYGSTAIDSTMSAYYLLMWVTPSIFIANLGNELKELVKKLLPGMLRSKFKKHWFEPTAIVTAWTKGWGDVWSQLKEQFDDEESGVEIQYEATITRIRRG